MLRLGRLLSERGGIVKKLDKTVVKEGCFIALGVLLLSIIMEAVFIIIRRWDYTVLLGNLLGGLVAVLNFFLLGITVQNAIGKTEEEIKNRVRFSHIMRMLLLAIGLIIGFVLPCFNSIAVILPYLFPRIAIALHPLFFKGEGKSEAE